MFNKKNKEDYEMVSFEEEDKPSSSDKIKEELEALKSKLEKKEKPKQDSKVQLEEEDFYAIGMYHLQKASIYLGRLA